jgi:hypothetical protein
MNNIEIYVSIASLIVAVMSLLNARSAKDKSTDASQKAFDASQKALEANHKAFEANQTANIIATGGLESSTRDLISQARRNMEDRIISIANFLSTINANKSGGLDKNDKKLLTTFEKAYRSAVEDWYNSYEEACAKYLDGKIDKERFRKSFKSEIKNIVEIKKEDEIMYSLINPKGTSRFRAIWKVYDEWENLEQ